MCGFHAAEILQTTLQLLSFKAWGVFLFVFTNSASAFQGSFTCMQAFLQIRRATYM